MINFRYHLVSLIAVLIALSLGVILGAGPLQARVTQAVSTQPDGAAVQASSAQLQASQREVSMQNAALDDLAGRALSGLLTDVPVALVALPGASADDVAGVRADLTSAGANVVGEVALSPNWDSPGMAQYRETLSTPVVSHLTQVPPADATFDAILGYAIVQILTQSGPEQSLLGEILTDQTTPIMQITEDPQGSAQAIVAIGARPGAGALSTDQSQSGGVAGSPAARAGLARAIGEAPRSGVVLGDASGADSVVSQIRAQGVAVTTIDTVGSRLGALSVSLALPSAGPQARAFGTGAGASGALPPVAGIG